MDAKDLAVFAAVARSGGITKAAQILNTVQSNVTQRIGLLEDELGVPLFHRHSRGARLENLLAKRGIVGVRQLDFGTLDGILGCVGAGIGLTLLPRVVVEIAAGEGRVAIHKLPPSEACVPTVLIRHRDVFVSTALMCFIELARVHLAPRNAERRQTLPTRFNTGRPVPLPSGTNTLERPNGISSPALSSIKRSGRR